MLCCSTAGKTIDYSGTILNTGGKIVFAANTAIIYFKFGLKCWRRKNGEGKFVRIPWKEAVDTIITQWKRIKETHNILIWRR